MITMFFDTETTGLPKFGLAADDPSQPRICSIATALFDQERSIEMRHDFVRPNGWTVPPEAAAIHGLTTERLTEIGIPIDEALSNFLDIYDRADELVVYGAEFDLKMIRGELRRASRPDRYKEKPTKCAMRRATMACKMPPTDAMLAVGRRTYKTPKLQEAHEIILGVPLVGAHDALNDVLALARIWHRLIANETERMHRSNELDAASRQ